MAERATGQDERAVLVDLARAWLLLGEQVQHLHEGSNSDLPSRRQWRAGSFQRSKRSIERPFAGGALLDGQNCAPALL